MVRIAVENSSWSNIGDAFYQSALTQSLSEVRPSASVVEIDAPMDRSFDVPAGNRRWYDHRPNVAADLLVLSGPIVTRAFVRRYGDLIRAVHARGGRYLLLSAFVRQPHDLTETFAFLREHPPLAFSSRDDPSFEKCRGIAPFEFRGICSAFYLNRLPRVADVEPERPYIVSSFYTRPEPVLTAADGVPSPAGDWSGLEVEAGTWPQWRWTRHFQSFFPRQEEVAGHRIVRPVQDLGQKFRHLNFPVANRYLSYNPQCYLSVFKGASLVISDRVHACVAGLSFGKPARLVGHFDRAALLQAHDVVEVRDGIMRADLARIDAMRGRFHDFLDEALGSVGW